MLYASGRRRTIVSGCSADRAIHVLRSSDRRNIALLCGSMRRGPSGRSRVMSDHSLEVEWETALHLDDTRGIIIRMCFNGGFSAVSSFERQISKIRERSSGKRLEMGEYVCLQSLPCIASLVEFMICLCSVWSAYWPGGMVRVRNDTHTSECSYLW